MKTSDNQKLSSTYRLRLNLSPWQLKVFQSKARNRVVRAGRQAGKTTLAAVIALADALKGESVLWVAPVSDQTQRGSDIVRSLIEKIPGALWSASRVKATFPGNGFIAFRSADNPDRLRGWTVHEIIIDEGRDCKNDIWNVLQPCLLRHNGRLLSISTPNGRCWLYDIEKQPDTEVFILSSGDNPYLSPRAIEQMRASLPEKLARQEIDAEIVDLSGSVFQPLIPCPRQSVRNQTHAYAFGIDVALSQLATADYTSVAIVDMTLKCICSYHRFQADFPGVVAGIEQLIKSWRPEAALIEVNGIGGGVYRQLSEKYHCIIPWTTSETTKQAIINEWLIGPPPVAVDEIIINEFKDFTCKRVGNRYIYEGTHDDVVISMLLGNHTLGGVTFEKLDSIKRPTSGNSWADF